MPTGMSDDGGLEKFLQARYGLREDDVPHDEIFPRTLISNTKEQALSQE